MQEWSFQFHLPPTRVKLNTYEWFVTLLRNKTELVRCASRFSFLSQQSTASQSTSPRFTNESIADPNIWKRLIRNVRNKYFLNILRSLKIYSFSTDVFSNMWNCISNNKYKIFYDLRWKTVILHCFESLSKVSRITIKQNHFSACLI